MVDYIFFCRSSPQPPVIRISELRTIEPLITKAKANKMDMLSGIKRVIHMYHTCGLTKTQVSVDNEFTTIQEDMRPIF